MKRVNAVVAEACGLAGQGCGVRCGGGVEELSDRISGDRNRRFGRGVDDEQHAN
jgi:hypothetical protein